MINKFKNTICILGMHRSGTSLLANILKDCGIYFGEENDLYQGDKGNILGHFEDKDVMNYNKKIFELANSDKNGINPFNVTNIIRTNKLETLHKQVEKILQKKLCKQTYWGVKDPRLSITIDFWEKHLKTPLFIFVFRNPYSVANSLKARDNLDVEFGLKYWEQYNRNIMQYLKDRSHFIIDYDYLIKYPHNTIFNLMNFIGITLDKTKLSIIATDVLPSLNHQKTPIKTNKNQRIEKLYLKLQMIFDKTLSQWIKLPEDIIKIDTTIFEDKISLIEKNLKKEINFLRDQLKIQKEAHEFFKKQANYFENEKDFYIQQSNYYKEELKRIRKKLTH